MIKQLFHDEICCHCGNDCSIGSGRYINRYEYYSDEVEGYVCSDCGAENEKLIEGEIK
tara:strand:+ start:948 stop:1121 length:174 start_codon:yes stop_codon:yes gene_type:complete